MTTTGLSISIVDFSISKTSFSMNLSFSIIKINSNRFCIFSGSPIFVSLFASPIFSVFNNWYNKPLLIISDCTFSTASTLYLSFSSFLINLSCFNNATSLVSNVGIKVFR